MKKTLITIATTALLIAGCGQSSDVGSCERIIEACHEKDTGSGEPHDCHESAEAAGVTDAECAEIEESCLLACE